MLTSVIYVALSWSNNSRMQYHHCNKQRRNEIYKEESDDDGNSQGIGWYVECSRDFGVGPIYFCPYCGLKLSD